MVLDSSTFAVEFVVGNPRGLGLGGVQAALGSRASLLGGTLSEASNVALGEHGGYCGVANGLPGGERTRLVVRCRNPSRFSGGFP